MAEQPGAVAEPAGCQERGDPRQLRRRFASRARQHGPGKAPAARRVAFARQQEPVVEPPAVADVELPAEGIHRPMAMGMPDHRLGDVGDPLALRQQLGDGDGLLRHQGRLEAADPVERRVRPGGGGVGAEAGVAAPAVPVAGGSDMARGRVAELAPDPLQQAAGRGRDLPPVGHRGLATTAPARSGARESRRRRHGRPA